MKFSYTPEGADPREWVINLNKLPNVEAEEIERRTDMTYGEWGDALERNSMRALHALLFVLMRRSTPSLKWDQIVFSMSEVSLEMELAEKKEALVRIREGIANGSISDDDARPAIDALVAEIAAEDEPESADEADPKVSPAPDSVSGGGLRSLPNSISIPATSTA